MRQFSSKIAHFIHEHFLKFLLLSYVIAIFLPEWGQSIRSIHLAKFYWFDKSGFEFTMPAMMLAFLLFNAGLGIKTQELLHLHQRPIPLLLGLVANLLIPVVFVLFIGRLTGLWHNPMEVQHLMVGLALIASMPIAGSSTAWVQNTDGNLVLSLGLVVFSTVLSPWTTPMVLHWFGLMTTGDFSEDLHELAQNGVHAFLSFTVVLPSLFGIFSHFLLGEKKIAFAKPYLKLFNYLNLLVLSYSNAALSLPQAFRNPDWDFLAFILSITVALCIFAFGAGWLIARILKADRSEQSALMFGLGMNNNGTGLVLSSMALADHPAVMLPVIFYNLAQQIVAGAVDAGLLRKNRQA